MAPRVLFVEDDPDLRQLMLAMVADRYEAEAVPDAESAIVRATESRIDVLVADVHLPRMSGIDLVPRLIHLHPHLAVIVVSGEPTIDMAVEAMKRGAMDFLTKPFTAANLRSLLQVAASRVPPVVRSRSRATTRLAMVAESETMRRLLSQVRAIAPYNVSVLISGETGTGKELVARLLHTHGSRAGRPFVALNCAAVPEQLLEDELFGHVKGAFTGAHEARVGRFEQADGGTLFLDEIGDMSVLLQAKLLRVLQERAFEKLGSGKTVNVDVRVVAATSADLDRAMAEGRFRPDLYYRLNVVRLDVPPLRQRLDDILPLAETFLQQFCAESSLSRKTLDESAQRVLRAYDWPGNTRQLRNAMERAAAMSAATVIYDRNLPEEVRSIRPSERRTAAAPASSFQPGSGADFDSVIGDVERQLLLDSLARARGNKLQAAKLLGMKRTTFMARLKRVRGH